MLNDIFKDFLLSTEECLKDTQHRNYAESLYEHYGRILEPASSYFSRPQLLRNRAILSKHKALHDLNNYILEFEHQFQSRGGKIVWVSSKEDALRELQFIIKEKGLKKIAKTNSTTFSELSWREYFKDANVEYMETEMQSFIQQTKKESIRESSFPILECSFKEASKVLGDQFHIESLGEENMVNFVKKYLINYCDQADCSVVGANFLVGSQGAIAICENEGNIGICSSFPETQIVVAGIDKMIPSMNDLHQFLALLSTHTSGGLMPYQTHILQGPRQADESDGPKELYLFLIDNRRTEVLKQVEQRRIFHCIRCGACNSVCPIYKIVGPKIYGDVYVGPIGSIVNPYLGGFFRSAHLSYACTLCKRCTEVCPMGIPLHELILANRADAVKQDIFVTFTPQQIRLLRKMVIKRHSMNAPSNVFWLKWHFKKLYTNQRIFPDISKRTFNLRWKELNEKK